MIVVPLVSALIGVGQTYLTTALGNRVMQDLRNRLFEHLQSMHLGFFTGTRTGDIQSRLGNDVGGVQSVVTETASSILSNTVTVIASLVGMLLLSWQLTIVAVALLPIFILLQIQVGRVRRRVAAQHPDLAVGDELDHPGVAVGLRRAAVEGLRPAARSRPPGTSGRTRSRPRCRSARR